MTCTVVDFGKDSVVYNITDCTKEELNNKLNLFFTAEGFSQKLDTEEEKAFQKGNKALRIMLGVFVKYFRVAVSVKTDGQKFSVRFLRDMSLVLSGGMIGIAKSRKEFERIHEAFKEYCKK